MTAKNPVTPAKAGVSAKQRHSRLSPHEVPASAGMMAR